MSSIPELAELIRTIEQDPALGDPLARLHAASMLHDDLDEISDTLLDHFVESARAAGCSWNQIGAALGVSKQAAQQRHTYQPSAARHLLQRIVSRESRGGRGRRQTARFSPAAQDTVVAARDEAQSLGHAHIGSEHLLLGLLTLDGIATGALDSLGIDHDRIRQGLVEAVGEGGETSSSRIPFTPRAKKILELALGECLSLGSRTIAPEHVLLGIVQEGAGLAMQLLALLGTDGPSIRRAVTDRIDEPPTGPAR